MDKRTTDGLYASSGITERSSRVASKHGALTAMCTGIHMVYAIRTTDGLVKIGCTSNLASRARQIPGEIIAFRPGDFDDEAVIHATLAAHRARGREYYHPTTAVLAVVNDLREHFNLPPLAA